METQPNAVKIDRMQTRQRMGEVIEISRSVLENSNLLTEGASIGPAEVQLTRRLVQMVAPVDVDTFRLHEHLQLSAKFARTIGQRLVLFKPDEFDSLNLDELEVLALLHDFGRFTTHRFYRNDIIEGLEFKAIGLRADLVKKLPSIKSYLKKDPTNSNDVNDAFNNLSIEQRIVEVADVHGKRKDDGTILTFDEVMDYHHSSRTKTGNELYPSEKQKDPQFVAFCEQIYHKLRGWLTSNGVNVDTIREDIMGEEISDTIRFAENIIAGNYASNFPSEESLDPREVFVGPILDLNDETLSLKEIAEAEGWIERKLAAKPDKAPVKAKYLSSDKQTKVVVYDVPLGQEGDKWFISRWQNNDEKPSYVFWPEEMYEEQLELDYTQIQD